MLNHDQKRRYHLDLSERADCIRYALSEMDTEHECVCVLFIEIIELAANYSHKLGGGYSFQQFADDMNYHVFGDDVPAYAQNLFDPAKV